MKKLKRILALTLALCLLSTTSVFASLFHGSIDYIGSVDEFDTKRITSQRGYLDNAKFKANVQSGSKSDYTIVLQSTSGTSTVLTVASDDVPPAGNTTDGRKVVYAPAEKFCSFLGVPGKMVTGEGTPRLEVSYDFKTVNGVGAYTKRFTLTHRVKEVTIESLNGGEWHTFIDTAVNSSALVPANSSMWYVDVQTLCNLIGKYDCKINEATKTVTIYTKGSVVRDDAIHVGSPVTSVVLNDKYMDAESLILPDLSDLNTNPVIKVTLPDGSYMSTRTGSAFLYGKYNRTMMPMRSFAESQSIGARIKYEPTEDKGSYVWVWREVGSADSRRLLAVRFLVNTNVHETFTIYCDTGNYRSSGVEYYECVFPIINDRTYIPIRLCLESLGYDLKYDPENRTVSVIDVHGSK